MRRTNPTSNPVPWSKMSVLCAVVAPLWIAACGSSPSALSTGTIDRAIESTAPNTEEDLTAALPDFETLAIDADQAETEVQAAGANAEEEPWVVESLDPAAAEPDASGAGEGEDLAGATATDEELLASFEGEDLTVTADDEADAIATADDEDLSEDAAAVALCPSPVASPHRAGPFLRVRHAVGAFNHHVRSVLRHVQMIVRHGVRSPAVHTVLTHTHGRVTARLEIVRLPNGVRFRAQIRGVRQPDAAFREMIRGEVQATNAGKRGRVQIAVGAVARASARRHAGQLQIGFMASHDRRVIRARMRTIQACGQRRVAHAARIVFARAAGIGGSIKLEERGPGHGLRALGRMRALNGRPVAERMAIRFRAAQAQRQIEGRGVRCAARAAAGPVRFVAIQVRDNQGHRRGAHRGNPAACSVARAGAAEDPNEDLIADAELDSEAFADDSIASFDGDDPAEDPGEPSDFDPLPDLDE